MANIRVQRSQCCRRILKKPAILFQCSSILLTVNQGENGATRVIFLACPSWKHKIDKIVVMDYFSMRMLSELFQLTT